MNLLIIKIFFVISVTNQLQLPVNLYTLLDLKKLELRTKNIALRSNFKVFEFYSIKNLT
jgi:hypothetical protein